jgi:dethiobiotin synthetase
MKSAKAAAVWLVTGTGTGVGKTLLTSLLLEHLRSGGVAAAGMKPFATGDRRDALLLHALQARALALDEINPFFFPEPVAPWVAARRARRQVRLATALEAIRQVRARAEVLLVEGCGGLLTPLGCGYSCLDLALRMNARVIVVAQNRLGVLNSVMLTVRVLEQSGIAEIRLVLMGAAHPDASSSSNLHAIKELCHGISVVELPWMGPRAVSLKGVKRQASRLRKKLKKVLA